MTNEATQTALQTKIAAIYNAISDNRTAIENGGSYFLHNNQIEILSELAAAAEKQLSQINA